MNRLAPGCMKMRRSRANHTCVVLAAVLPLFAGGCEWAKNGFKVGPNYQQPVAPVAANWIDYRDNTTSPAANEEQLTKWWKVFNDPVLDSLISDAYRQSLSLRIAGERIVQARAVRGIAVGNLFPQTQELVAGYGVYKGSDKAAFQPTEQWYQDTQLGLNVGWELDFWGRYRRSVEAADAAIDASVANFDDALVLLLSDVASTYVQYRTLQERLFLAHENVQIQTEAYQLASDNFRLGAATERDAQQAKQILEQTRSLIPDLEASLRRTNNALCVLLGIPSEELANRLGHSGTIPKANPDWTGGIPADLLRRRPDVRRAEREAAAQSAEIGIAKSDLYPRFSLLGSIGVQSEDPGDLFRTPGSFSAFGGPAFQWDLFNYGRIENNVKVQESRFRERVLVYQQAVLNANREAEDAIIGFIKAQEREKYLSESVTAAKRTVEITYDQYRQGAVDFTPVFIFEAALTNQQDQLAQARGDISQNLISLFRSLGGGWEAQAEKDAYLAPAVPAPTSQPVPSTRPTAITPTTRP